MNFLTLRPVDSLLLSTCSVGVLSIFFKLYFNYHPLHSISFLLFFYSIRLTRRLWIFLWFSIQLPNFYFFFTWVYFVGMFVSSFGNYFCLSSLTFYLFFLSFFSFILHLLNLCDFDILDKVKNFTLSSVIWFNSLLLTIYYCYYWE